MPAEHTRVYAETYECKDGTFRGVVVEYDGYDKRLCEPIRTENFPTFTDAKSATIRAANALVAGRPFRGGTYRNRAGKSWRYNYWL